MPPEKIQSDENQSDLTSVNSDNTNKSNAKVPGFGDNRPEAAHATALKEQLAKKDPQQMKQEMAESVKDDSNSSKIKQFLNGLDPNQFNGKTFEDRKLQIEKHLKIEN